MKRIILTFALVLTGLALFAQSPRIRLNQITKDSITGSIVLSGSDSNMVYSRDFFINFQDSVLILFGDTLSTTATAFSGVTTDLTLTGNGTVGNELKVDTGVIATVSALSDSLAGIISSVTTDLTLTGDGSLLTPLKVDTAVIATLKALADSVATRGTVSSVAVSAGAGISVSGSPITTSGTITVTNTAPDQTVALTGGTGISTSGTYPNFTITNSSPNATHTGDVTGATALTIANDAVTNAKMANMAQNTIKGRITTSTGDPEDLTASQVRTILNVADGATANAGTVTNVSAGTQISGMSMTITNPTTTPSIATAITSQSDFRTAIGAGTGNGTVTGVTAGTFLSGGTITSSGTIALDTASAGLKTYISENSSGGSSFNNLTETADTVFVSKFLNVDTSTLYVDAVNNRVGIGTSAPLKGLDVKGGLLVDADSTLPQAFFDAGGWPNNPPTTSPYSNIQGELFTGNVGTSSPIGRLRLGSNQNAGLIDFNNYFSDPIFGGSNSVERMDTSRIGLRINMRAGGSTERYIEFSAYDLLSSSATSFIRFYSPFNSTRPGFVGIGTTAPAYKLDVNGDIRGDAIYSDNNTFTQTPSDIRLKKNISEYQYITDKLTSLNVVNWEWNDTRAELLEGRSSKDKIMRKTESGLIAQEVEGVFPDLVGEDYTGYKTLSYTGFIVPLIKGFQEQQEIIETQKQEIDQLKTQIQNILTEINNLKNN